MGIKSMAKKETTELMEFLKETVTSLLIAKKVPLDMSQQIAVDVVKQLRFEWGGAVIYIPFRSDDTTTQRNKQIRAEFNGSNQKELSRKHKISLVSIYSILKKTNPTT